MPRVVERVDCTMVRGHQVASHLEVTEGSAFLRLKVRGPQAREVLMAESRRFFQDHLPVRDAVTIYRMDGSWCALLVGQVTSGEPVDNPMLQLASVRTQEPWSTDDVETLRTTYLEARMRGCVEAFPTRSYDSISAALKRYNIRQWAKAQQEVMA